MKNIFIYSNTLIFYIKKLTNLIFNENFKKGVAYESISTKKFSNPRQTRLSYYPCVALVFLLLDLSNNLYCVC